ncbi:MAG TPA: response regulator [Terriglobales bacterium]|nr:response regulator [Terriglobales bacterium]
MRCRRTDASSQLPKLAGGYDNVTSPLGAPILTVLQGFGSVKDDVVFLIDDDPSILRSVSRLLRSHHLRVQTCRSAQEFLVQQAPPGAACIVLDLQMPGVSGLDLQRLLAQRRQIMPSIFISGHGSILSSVNAMKEGAVDFLTKPFDDEQLLSAVHTALTQSRQACARRDALDRDRAIFQTLTQREQQVCVRVAQGMLNKQIGGEFGTTEKTIKVQRGRVMQKLGAQSVADVVRLVERLRSAGHL